MHSNSFQSETMHSSRTVLDAMESRYHGCLIMRRAIFAFRANLFFSDKGAATGNVQTSLISIRLEPEKDQIQQGI